MPSLLIFDDDGIKCELAGPVIKAIQKGDISWTLAYNEPLRIKVDFDSFVKRLGSCGEALVLVDIEIKKPQKGKDWRTQASTYIAAKIESGSKTSCEMEIKRLETHFGKHSDYQLSLCLIAYLLHLGIPVITISTKPNSAIVTSHVSTCAQSAGLPSLYWAENWKTAWDKKAIPENASDLAKRIVEEWNKHRGRMFTRLWPMAASGWFPPGVEANHVIKHSHSTELQATPQYSQLIREYLSSVSGVPVTEFARANEDYDVSYRRHESLKRIVGAAASAHAGDSYPPELNIVALLAAAWDSNASKWFPCFDWMASCQMMADGATRQSLTEVILAIGGEDGLFKHLIRREGKNGGSTLEKVEARKDSVLLTMTFRLDKDRKGLDRGIMQKFNAARVEAESGAKPSIQGDATDRLFKVWEKLGATKRMTDIEVTGSTIKFFKPQKSKI